MSVCKWRIGLAVPLLALGMGSAQAAMLEGDTVWFSFNDNLLGLFGDPSVSGDTLVFNPVDFDADVAGGGSDITDAITPVITITAKANYVIDDVELAESGSYFRIDPTAGMATLVAAAGNLIVNGTGVAFSAGGLGAFQSPADVVANGLSLVDWAAEAEAEDLGALLATVQIRNVLVAGAVGGRRGIEMAFIGKDVIELEVETAVIPIPAAVWLFGSALIGLSVVGRRRLAA